MNINIKFEPSNSFQNHQNQPNLTLGYKALVQRIIILSLTAISVSLFCFNIFLVLPYILGTEEKVIVDDIEFDELGHVKKSGSDYLGYKGAQLQLDEEKIRDIMEGKNNILDGHLSNENGDILNPGPQIPRNYHEPSADQAIRFRKDNEKDNDHENQNLNSQNSNDEEPILNYAQQKYYPYKLNPYNLCRNKYDNSKESIYLLLVVKSVTNQFARRQAIRKTWGDTHKVHLNLEQTGYSNRAHLINQTQILGKQGGQELTNPIIIKRLFLLADSGNKYYEPLLKQEFEEYHDILQGDFIDSFRNLTLKDIMFLNWQQVYCPQVQFIFKGDDDVFVNVFNVLKYIEGQSLENQMGLFTGSVLYPSPRITDPRSKYYVSSNLWSEKYYPPYVSGGGFIMSSFIANQIFEVMKVLPIIPIDDAFVGICLEKMGVKPINHKGFKSWGLRRGSKDVCVFRDIMTLHKMDPDEMGRSWLLLLESFISPPKQCSKFFSLY